MGRKESFENLALLVQYEQIEEIDGIFNDKPHLIYLTGEDGKTLLHIAAEFGNEITVKYLIWKTWELHSKHKKEVKNKYLDTSYYSGNLSENINIIFPKLIVNLYIEDDDSDFHLSKILSIEDHIGNTPLHLAVINDRYNVFNLLVTKKPAIINIVKLESNELSYEWFTKLAEISIGNPKITEYDENLNIEFTCSFTPKEHCDFCQAIITVSTNDSSNRKPIIILDAYPERDEIEVKIRQSKNDKGGLDLKYLGSGIGLDGGNKSTSTSYSGSLVKCFLSGGKNSEKAQWTFCPIKNYSKLVGNQTMGFFIKRNPDMIIVCNIDAEAEIANWIGKHISFLRPKGFTSIKFEIIEQGVV